MSFRRQWKKSIWSLQFGCAFEYAATVSTPPGITHVRCVACKAVWEFDRQTKPKACKPPAEPDESL